MDWAKSLPVSGDYVRNHILKALTKSWFQARRGRITASTRAQILFEHRTWYKLGQELAAELQPDWVHVDRDALPMKWGRDHEREALDAVNEKLGVIIEEPGLILHPAYDYAGSTPDGFITDQTTVQIKCPFSTKNHMKTVLDRMMSAQYYCQVEFEGWTSQREKILYGSYDPRVPKDIRLFLIDVPANKDMWGVFEKNLELFRKDFEADGFPLPGKLRVDSGIADCF